MGSKRKRFRRKKQEFKIAILVNSKRTSTHLIAIFGSQILPRLRFIKTGSKDSLGRILKIWIAGLIFAKSDLTIRIDKNKSDKKKWSYIPELLDQIGRICYGTLKFREIIINLEKLIWSLPTKRKWILKSSWKNEKWDKFDGGAKWEIRKRVKRDTR